MTAEVQTIDVSDHAELLDLAEEVRRSGIGLLLVHGEEELAVLAPISPRRATRLHRRPTQNERDTLLNIIGIGESAEPTDIARDEQEYLAEAYAPDRA